MCASEGLACIANFRISNVSSPAVAAFGRIRSLEKRSPYFGDCIPPTYRGGIRRDHKRARKFISDFGLRT